jgi:hypothetical protein
MIEPLTEGELFWATTQKHSGGYFANARNFPLVFPRTNKVIRKWPMYAAVIGCAGVLAWAVVNGLRWIF